jgi:hypothetical protein
MSACPTSSGSIRARGIEDGGPGPRPRFDAGLSRAPRGLELAGHHRAGHEVRPKGERGIGDEVGQKGEPAPSTGWISFGGRAPGQAAAPPRGRKASARPQPPPFEFPLQALAQRPSLATSPHAQNHEGVMTGKGGPSTFTSRPHKTLEASGLAVPPRAPDCVFPYGPRRVDESRL